MASDDVLNVEYVEGYFNTQNPNLLNYVAALGGFTPTPTDRPFTYCDLGCGMGTTVNTLAASFPDGDFYGIDANAKHIQHAQAVARAAGVERANFLEADFRELLTFDLPSFDFVCLHGVHSWVGEDVRRALVEFLAAKVKDGGCVYLGYNTMPGWAPLLPLRDAMLQHARSCTADPLEQVRAGMAYLKLLSDNGARYFVENPVARIALEEMLKQDPHYVAHEYFAPDLHASYFHHLAEELRRAGLVFAGSMPVHQNYDLFVLPPAFGEAFSTARTREVRETHKSFVLNERFRRDVFVRAKTTKPLSGDSRIELFRPLRFTSPKRRENIDLEVQLPGGMLSFDAPINRPLLDALATSSPTLAELEALPSMSAFGAGDVFHALELLVTGGEVVPSRAKTAEFQHVLATDGDQVRMPETVRVPLRFNEWVLRQRLLGAATIMLTSPVLGGPIPIALGTALCLRVLLDGPRATMETRMLELLQARSEPLVLPATRTAPAKPLTTVEDTRAAVKAFIADFSAPKLANLCRLGIAAVDS